MSKRKSCKKGYSRSRSTGRCVKKCKKGQTRSRVSGKCKRRSSKINNSKKRRKCPKTSRCACVGVKCMVKSKCRDYTRCPTLSRDRRRIYLSKRKSGGRK